MVSPHFGSKARVLDISDIYFVCDFEECERFAAYVACESLNDSYEHKISLYVSTLKDETNTAAPTP